MNEHAISALLARAIQAEQERDAANAERRRTARKRNKVAAECDRLRTALEQIGRLDDIINSAATARSIARAALIEAGESLDLTGRVLDFEIVAEPEETRPTDDEYHHAHLDDRIAPDPTCPVCNAREAQ